MRWNRLVIGVLFASLASLAGIYLYKTSAYKNFTQSSHGIASFDSEEFFTEHDLPEHMPIDEKMARTKEFYAGNRIKVVAGESLAVRELKTLVVETRGDNINLKFTLGESNGEEKSYAVELPKDLAPGDYVLAGTFDDGQIHRTPIQILDSQRFKNLKHELKQIPQASAMSRAAVVPLPGTPITIPIGPRVSYQGVICSGCAYEITFTGEHLFRWHFDEEPGLRPFRDTALVLAEHEWPRLYDPGVLSRCEVPCAASIYGDDPFVIREFSEETARLIPTMRPWLTNEYEHGGLRTSGDRVFDRLLDLVRERVD